MAISFVRTIILFLIIVVSMRIMGKRQLGELEPSELVVAVMISDIAVNPLQNIGTPLIYGVIPVLTLLCCEIIVSGIVVKNIKLRKIICGNPNIIIQKGKINQKEMEKNRFTLDELTVELRKKNVTDISTVKEAILETNGSLSILLYTNCSPTTPKQLNLSVPDESSPVILISNGRLLRNNMNIMNVTDKWLNSELKKCGLSSYKDVYLFMIDDNNNVYCAAKET